jgi:hypothetical protein
MNMKHRKCLGIIVTVICAFSVIATEIHVNNLKGDDANNGTTPASAVATFARAMKLVQPGGKLNITNTGTPYYERLIIRGDLGKDGNDFIIEGNNAIISGLRPLATNKFIERDGAFFIAIGKRGSHMNPKLFAGGRVLPETTKREELNPGKFFWAGDGFYFIPEAGKTLADYKFQGSIEDSGVAFIGGKNILLRNLISEHNPNDGFNLHGSCYGITVENVVGRNNGDDGFSAHADVEVQVKNSVFHGNTYGIEDVHASITSYRNVKIYGNRTGIHFSGGIHQLINCEIKDNSIQLVIDPGIAFSYLGTSREPAIFSGKCFVKNTRISGNGIAVRIGSRASLTLISSDVLSEKGTALELFSGSELFILASVVRGALPLQMNKAKIFGDKNLFFPDKFRINGTDLNLETFKKATSGNAESFSETPRYKDGILVQQPFMQKSPRIALGVN